MNSDVLIYEKDDGIAWVTLNRPEVLNALNMEMRDELWQVLHALREDPDVAVAIFKGAGERAFSAGADTSLLSTFSVKEAKPFSEKGQRVCAKIRELSKPVIAVVNGYALGGGCELAMACDLRIASEKARFSQAEINLGLIPGWGGTQILPRIVGPTRATEMILLGRMIDASEACNIGLVNRVVAPEKLDEEAVKLAEALALGPPRALAAAKRLLNLSLQVLLDEGLKNEAEDFSSLFSTEDFREGVAASKERRKPIFKGK